MPTPKRAYPLLSLNASIHGYPTSPAEKASHFNHSLFQDPKHLINESFQLVVILSHRIYVHLNDVVIYCRYHGNVPPELFTPGIFSIVQLAKQPIHPEHLGKVRVIPVERLKRFSPKKRNYWKAFNSIALLLNFQHLEDEKVNRRYHALNHALDYINRSRVFQTHVDEMVNTFELFDCILKMFHCRRESISF